jgi:hypothetical protein
MPRQAICLGLTLAIVSLAMKDISGQATAPQKQAESIAKQQPKNETVTALLKTQLLAAQKCYRAALDTMAVQQFGGMLVQVQGNTRARPDLAYAWSARWLEAQRELAESKEERIAAFADHQKRMKQLLDNVKLVVGNGNGGILPASDNPAAEWYLAEADLWLVRERGK